MSNKSGKRNAIGANPQNAPVNADQWISSQNPSTAQEKQIRLTFNIDKALHKRIRRICLEKEIPMAEELRNILKKEFAEE